MGDGNFKGWDKQRPKARNNERMQDFDPTRQQHDHGQDEDRHGQDKTENERQPLGPTDKLGKPGEARAKRKERKKGKQKHAQSKNEHKGNSKEDNSKTLERQEIDWTGLDWEDGGDNVLRETNPRTSKRPQAHGSLRSTWLSRRK